MFCWAVACIKHTVACSGLVTCVTNHQEQTHELINAMFVMSHSLRSFCNVKERQHKLQAEVLVISS